MTPDGPLPRRFGAYLLTAALGSDALGRVFRALRVSGERGFVRLRIFESSEISEDAVLDAIEENGEIHTFLKNPAIARGVEMDAVEGVPFLAWNEPNGRTLDALLARARSDGHGIPVEHALLIAEKIATALDHAYNTTVDDERTLHGLVWPGFVSVSDDGETRLTGFGLASGFLPSLGKPRLYREIAPYLAPEERADLTISKNSDVFSVGALLFELLFGRLLWPTDPLGELRKASRPDAPIPPEVTAVLHNCLAPADSRYQSSGELRRELGKVLFSGPYSPSTFNLAFFLNSVFSAEIEAENRARAVESTFDPEATPEASPLPASAAPMRPARPQSNVPAAPGGLRPYAIGGVLLLAAALIGTTYLITRQPHRETPRPVIPAAERSTLKPLPTALPTSLPASGTTEAQIKEEVVRRVAANLKKLEGEMRRSKAAGPIRAPRPEPTQSRVAPAEQPAPDHEAPQAASPAVTSEVEPTAGGAAGSTSGPQPTPQAAETSQAPGEFDTPPKILRIVKAVYPAAALQARIRGTVVLRVLVSEDGTPQEIRVLKRAAGGLAEAAVTAVGKWTFEPALDHGRPVRAWTTITIPFEP